jgi:hypothetical protein
MRSFGLKTGSSGVKAVIRHYFNDLELPVIVGGWTMAAFSALLSILECFLPPRIRLKRI